MIPVSIPISTLAVVLGSIALLVNIGIIYYSYRVLKIASFVSLWRRSWTYFIAAMSVIAVHRVFDLIAATKEGADHPILSFVHHAPSVVIGIFLALFIYTITMVFKNITSFNKESRFMLLLRNLPAGVIVYSEDTSIAYANQRAKEILGLAGTVLEGMYDIDLDSSLHFLREDGTPLPESEYPVNVVLSTGKSFFGKVYGVNHTKPTKWVLVNAYLTGNGDKQVVVVFTDITKLKESEDICRASEDLYKNAFMSSHDAIVITELKTGLIYSINKTFTKLTGYEESEIISKTSIEINLWKNMEDRRLFQKELEQFGFIRDFDTYFIAKDGSDIHGLLSASVLVNNGGHVLTSVKLVCAREHNQRKEDKKD